MFERLISQIITELGPSGVLVVGLYFSISIPLNKIAKKIDSINIDTIPTKESIMDCTEKICERVYGKD